MFLNLLENFLFKNLKFDFFMITAVHEQSTKIILNELAEWSIPKISVVHTREYKYINIQNIK